MLGGAGTQTAGLAFGGNVPPGTTRTNVTEEYDGTTWTSGGNLNLARFELAGTGDLQTAALAIGGNSAPATDAVEQYDGSTWTSISPLGTARAHLTASGNTQAALAIGGEGAGGATEEFTGAGVAVTKTITVS